MLEQWLGDGFGAMWRLAEAVAVSCDLDLDLDLNGIELDLEN